jgi:putative ABC transport system permease protein
MKTLFGVPMDTIMVVMLGAFLLVTAVLAVLALRNRLLFKLALRNIPRRRAQTILIVVGLMLSTVIITSAFGTGDTVSYSVRASVLTGLGNVDEEIFHTAGAGNGTLVNGEGPIAADVAARIQAAVAANPAANGSTVAMIAGAPVQDRTSGQTKTGSLLEAFPTSYPRAFGGLTAVDGTSVTLAQLGPNEIYLNKKAGDDLNARPGDRVTVYFGGRPLPVRVRAILRNEQFAAGGLSTAGRELLPSVLLPLERLAQQPNVVLIANKGGATGGAANTDAVTAPLRALLANARAVATAQALLASHSGSAVLTKLTDDPANVGVKVRLTALRAAVAQPGQSSRLKSLLSDPEVSAALQTIKDPALARPLNDALATISDYSVQTVKKDGLHTADQFGSVFTTIFIVFGLFSIFAGIMMIFLIFVMLAAERRAEMGMARAIGTKRRHLIQQFLFEGYVYDLGAALVGTALGILVGLGMVEVMASLLGAADFTVQSHIEPRSVVVAFCLGALVTFLTVSFSSWRVSRLNIVAAIRDLPESFGIKGGLGDAYRRSLQNLARIRQPRVAIIMAALVLLLVTQSKPPVQGLALAIGLYVLWSIRPLYLGLYARGPLLLLSGYVLAAHGVQHPQDKSALYFGLGASLILIGVAMLARWIMGGLRVPDAIRNRIGFSLAGLGLVAYWLLPDGTLRRFGVPELTGGIEMFFIAGMLLVLGGVWTVMYNADLLAAGLVRAFGRRGGLAPSIRMATSYPMQFKFRTGVTLAMFSLVIFTLMVMSVLIDSTAGSLVLNRDTGGYQIYGTVNPSTPISNLDRDIAANPALRGRIAAYGALANIAIGLRQPGQQDQSWYPYNVNIVDDAYLRSTRFTLHARALGFSSDRQVWQTLRSRPGYAVVDGSLIPSRDGGAGLGGGMNSFAISGFHYEDTTFRPTTIELRDSVSGRVGRLTVIGVLDQRAAYLGDLTAGIYTGENTLTAGGLPPVPPTTFVFRVAPGASVHVTALALGKAFFGNGLDIKESQKQYDTGQAINIGLNNLLEGFMALGLVVGIAALGVVATRSVVERRQQIGMLRAIGFPRGTIRAGFLLESSVVAILGTLLGVVLGIILARNLVVSMAKTDPGVVLTMPWAQIGLIVLLTYAASLLTTYLPARQASRIYPAEALRYE